VAHLQISSANVTGSNIDTKTCTPQVGLERWLVLLTEITVKTLSSAYTEIIMQHYQTISF